MRVPGMDSWVTTKPSDPLKGFICEIRVADESFLLLPNSDTRRPV